MDSVKEGKRFFGGLQWHRELSYRRLAIWDLSDRGVVVEI
jgi:hypothetical protein